MRFGDCKWVLFLTAVQFLLSVSATASENRGGQGLWIGPLYTAFSLTLGEGERREAVGPFWYSEEIREPNLESPSEAGLARGSVAETTMALPPLFSVQERPQTEGVSWDFVYPILTYDRFGRELYFQVLQLLSFSAGRDATGTSWENFSLFPLYFQRRASDPALNYTAVWPIYGHVEKRFFRDEADWILWPAYVRTRKKDIITENFLVPLFHVRHGPGLRGWQFWPLVGQENQTAIVQTNSFGMAETKPGHESLFVLWPIFFHNDAMLGTTNPVRQRLLLPLFSYQLSQAKDIRTYLWPIGLTLTDDRTHQYNQTDFAWPLISFGRGPERQLDRVFPLFSRDHRENRESLSILWPVYQQRSSSSETIKRDVVRLLLGVYCDETLQNLQTGKTASRTDLWPLFITRRDMEGRERFQILALLEPFLPHNDGVKRNYSPLWSIWRSESDKQAGKQSSSFLWNLYRCERTPTTRRYSLMFGLVQHGAGPEGSWWRWLHLFGGKPEKQPPTSETKRSSTVQCGTPANGEAMKASNARRDGGEAGRVSASLFAENAAECRRPF
ncbi:MAG: hypothetical protein GX456_08700 [Verrucomicrobia bacterium]|nr:hypothetical protein [Verrucomicrobiota bacterium]